MLDFTFLQQKIAEKGISYRRLAEQMGFKSSGTVHKWIHGNNQIRAQHLERLAQILEVPVQSLFVQSDVSQLICKGGGCE